MEGMGMARQFKRDYLRSIYERYRKGRRTESIDIILLLIQRLTKTFSAKRQQRSRSGKSVKWQSENIPNRRGG